VHHLERDEAARMDFARSINNAHAAAADHSQHFVGSNRLRSTVCGGCAGSGTAANKRLWRTGNAGARRRGRQGWFRLIAHCSALLGSDVSEKTRSDDTPPADESINKALTLRVEE